MIGNVSIFLTKQDGQDELWGLIGSRLSGACLALKSQVPRSQAQCMQPHRDWLLVCMLVGYAGKLIGWPPGCTARLYFGAAMKESWHAASQAR